MENTAKLLLDLGLNDKEAQVYLAGLELGPATAQQLAQTSVDTDEEAANMLAYQRAYEGSARVLTAIDEMLDTLINRTGVVGR